MEHTMSMYPTKDAMIEAMQAEIGLLEAKLAEEKYVAERTTKALAQISIAAGYTPAKNESVSIDTAVEKICEQLAEARNILAAGHAVLACGERVQLDRSMKHEPTEATTQLTA